MRPISNPSSRSRPWTPRRRAIPLRGYFLAGLSEGMSIPDTLRMSAKASSIAVTRPGAVPSIPLRSEVMEALRNS